MISKKLEDAINAQINAEFWSAYLYLSMSADFAAKGYPGFANWMNVQFQEEQAHALKFFNYLISRGGKPQLKAIAKVPVSWNAPIDAMKETLTHEEKVTSLINNLYSLSVQENDYATQSMLKWYIDEQVQEEETAKTIIDTLKMIGDNGFGVYQLDKELALRVFTPIATTPIP